MIQSHALPSTLSAIQSRGWKSKHQHIKHPNAPESFWEVRVHQLEVTPSLSGLCVGYERGEWRAEQLAKHAMEWLPEFALKTSECQAMNSNNAIQLIRRAAKVVYDSAKFDKRGEFGELFLHIAIRQIFHSLPAISKIYYKTANNETVKGFDAVHVVGPPNDLELWLGEAKFYNNFDRAVRDVVAELIKHTDMDYLRNEFSLIINKIDEALPHAPILKKLLSPNTSLDEVFKRACIPVLLTYDSSCLANHATCNDGYIAAFTSEINANYKKFVSKSLPQNVRIHLFLLPLHTKRRVIETLNEQLKIWQRL